MLSDKCLTVKEGQILMTMAKFVIIDFEVTAATANLSKSMP
jgi:hypothetical protein